MKPTRLQYFFAQDWPLRLWLTVVSLLVVTGAVWACEPSLAVFRDWKAVLWLGAVGLLALPVGWFGAVVVAWFVLGPIYYDRGVKNGAPFQPGDRVRILVGPHRDRIARVYSLWQGDTVRVELGEKEKESFNDIFAPTQLLREPDASTGEGPDNG